MRIAFISSLNPTDIHSWSGTLFHIYTSLAKANEMVWIGPEILAEVRDFHINNRKESPFIPEYYAMMIGKLLSDKLRESHYDILIYRDFYFCAYLTTDIPIVHIGDTTFHLFKDYLNIQDKELENLCEDLENRSIHKANKLLYSSEWAKIDAIEHYKVDSEKVKVIEFGPNLESIKTCPKKKPNQFHCKLLFVGTNWIMKGGSKAIETCYALREKGINCELTIVGSSPLNRIDEQFIKVYPFIDKNTMEGKELFAQLYRESHFLIVPTLFDCYGIVFCEAAAYGVPSLAANVGGVGQIIRSGENGFLLSPKTDATGYAECIIQTIEKDTYRALSDSAIADFSKRLNWNVWLEKTMDVLFELMTEQNDTYIPVYALSKKGQTHILKEFKGKPEFKVKIIQDSSSDNNSLESWNSIVQTIKIAIENKDEVIILCKEEHHFTKNYSPTLLIKEIQEAYIQGAEMLLGDIKDFGQAIPVGYHRYWIDHFKCSHFIVVFSSLFERILSYQFEEYDKIDDVFSLLSPHKMVIYPFISSRINNDKLDLIETAINRYQL